MPFQTLTEAPTILSRSRAVQLILEHAERLDLPMPFDVTVTDHSDPSLMFRSLGDLAQWALWIGAIVIEQPHGDRVHHVATGHALEQPIRLVRVEGRVL